MGPFASLLIYFTVNPPPNQWAFNSFNLLPPFIHNEFSHFPLRAYVSCLTVFVLDKISWLFIWSVHDLETACISMVHVWKQRWTQVKDCSCRSQPTKTVDSLTCNPEVQARALLMYFDSRLIWFVDVVVVHLHVMLCLHSPLVCVFIYVS